MIRRILNKLIFRLKNRTCSMGKGSNISRKTKAGERCHFGKNCSVAKNVILGSNIHIGEGAKLRNIQIGNNTMIEGGVIIVGPGNGKIIIGNDCYIGVNNVLDTSNNIFIGDYVHIAGPSTGLWCHTSVEMCMNSVPRCDKGRDKYRPTDPINIASNVYIGGNCTIYPGITIGHHSIVAPNSAVTKDVPSNLLVGGVPARKIRNN